MSSGNAKRVDVQAGQAKTVIEPDSQCTLLMLVPHVVVERVKGSKERLIPELVEV